MTTYEDLVDATLAARADAAGRAAAQDDHPRRGGRRAGHRVDLVPQRAAARVRAGDGDPHRRRRGRHGDPGRRARRPVPRRSPTPTARSATPCGCAIELQPVAPYVRLQHRRFADADACAAAIAELADAPRRRARRLRRRHGVRRRRAVPDPGHVRRRARRRDPATTPASRSTTGPSSGATSTTSRCATTCGAGTPTGSGARGRSACSIPLVRRLWPRRYRRSDVYRRLVAFDRRHRLSARLDTLRGRPPQEPVVQDVEIPVAPAAEFLDFFHREIGITPVWLCPLRLRVDRAVAAVPARARRAVRQRRVLVRVAAAPGQAADSHNRSIEELVDAISAGTSPSTPPCTTPRTSSGSTTTAPPTAR